MKIAKSIIPFFCFLLELLHVHAQIPCPTLDHYETIFFGTDQFKFQIGSSATPANWNTNSFNDASWINGQGGIGYGDGDDNTVISSSISLYVRKSFNVVDISMIQSALLHIDYDDAFVAYFNGVEFARNNIGTPGIPPLWSDAANGDHEALIYQGYDPEMFLMDPLILQQNIVSGNNVLAIEIHNTSALPSDMSCIPYFTIGVSDTSFTFNVPPGFVPPVFNSSNLSLLSINTNGQSIPYTGSDIVAELGIISNPSGQRNYFSDAFNNFDGDIHLHIRGQSSSGFPKKSFAVETLDTNGISQHVSLLGMPGEDDWVLHGPYSDKVLMRNLFIYTLMREMGWWAPRTVYCELIIDCQYQGVYVLMEHINRNKNRVNVVAMDDNDNVGDSVTGGYIVKIDKYNAGQQTAWWSPISNFQGQAKNINFQFDYPKPSVITPWQKNYVQSAFNQMEYNLISPDFADPDSGYRKLIDVNSFMDYFIAQEITDNVDGYRLSNYLNKQRDSHGGKIAAGPLWDFDIAWGNADYCDGDNYANWALDFPCDLSVIPFWWHRLWQDSIYTNQLRCRWDDLRSNVLNTGKLMAQIDSFALLIDEGQERNFETWQIHGMYVWPNPYYGASFQEDIDYFKQWITNRLGWIDANLPGNTTQCQSVFTDDITITEINYNSATNFDCGDWFELFNKSTQAIDLSNWVIKDNGDNNSFTIPQGTIIQPDSFYVIAKQLLKFTDKFGSVSNFTGGFGFNLSNNSDEINIWDEWNYPVLSMAFSDSSPWVQGADGTGYTLVSQNVNGNINDPMNWDICNLHGSPGASSPNPCVPDTNTFVADLVLNLKIYPNPVNNYFTLEISSAQKKQINLFDVQGRLLFSENSQSSRVLVDCSSYDAGVYFVEVKFGNQIFRDRILKLKTE